MSLRVALAGLLLAGCGADESAPAAQDQELGVAFLHKLDCATEDVKARVHLDFTNVDINPPAIGYLDGKATIDGTSFDIRCSTQRDGDGPGVHPRFSCTGPIDRAAFPYALDATFFQEVSSDPEPQIEVPDGTSAVDELWKVVERNNSRWARFTHGDVRIAVHNANLDGDRLSKRASDRFAQAVKLHELTIDGSPHTTTRVLPAPPTECHPMHGSSFLIDCKELISPAVREIAGRIAETLGIDVNEESREVFSLIRKTVVGREGGLELVTTTAAGTIAGERVTLTQYLLADRQYRTFAALTVHDGVPTRPWTGKLSIGNAAPQRLVCVERSSNICKELTGPARQMCLLAVFGIET